MVSKALHVTAAHVLHIASSVVLQRVSRNRRSISHPSFHLPSHLQSKRESCKICIHIKIVHVPCDPVQLLDGAKGFRRNEIFGAHQMSHDDSTAARDTRMANTDRRRNKWVKAQPFFLSLYDPSSFSSSISFPRVFFKVSPLFSGSLSVFLHFLFFIFFRNSVVPSCSLCPFLTLSFSVIFHDCSFPSPLLASFFPSLFCKTTLISSLRHQPLLSALTSEQAGFVQAHLLLPLLASRQDSAE